MLVLMGYHQGEDFLWLTFRTLNFTSFTDILPCQMLLAQMPLSPFFLVSHFCCTDFILLSVKVTCLDGFSSGHGVCLKGRISSYLFLIPFRAKPGSVHIIGV